MYMEKAKAFVNAMSELIAMQAMVAACEGCEVGDPVDAAKEKAIEALIRLLNSCDPNCRL